MLSLIINLNHEIFCKELMMTNIGYSGNFTFPYPGTLIGLEGILFLLIVIISGYMISDISSRIKRKTAADYSQDKSINEILKYECQKRQEKKIKLDIFTGEVHCVASTIQVFYRKIGMEYIVVFDTDLGYLVGRDFDSMNAEKEFLFICKEDEAGNRGGIDVKINFFDYKLYSKQNILNQ